MPTSSKYIPFYQLFVFRNLNQRLIGNDTIKLQFYTEK
jgi:hypothetical protein